MDDVAEAEGVAVETCLGFLDFSECLAFEKVMSSGALTENLPSWESQQAQRARADPFMCH